MIPKQCHYISFFRYDAECHWVHYSDNYTDIGAAVASGKKDALSVFGVLFEIDNFNQQDNRAWFQVSFAYLHGVQNYPQIRRFTEKFPWIILDSSVISIFYYLS